MRFLRLVGSVLALALVPGSGLAAGPWTPLCPGIEHASFEACSKSDHDDSRITIVRVDPALARLRLLSVSELGLARPLRAREWADRYDLALVINAGMFATDWRTHVGYLKASDGHTNSDKVMTDYKSVLAFGPRMAGIPPATIADLEDTSIPRLSERYSTVIQNIRMVRSPGKVVWGASPRKWSEAATGIDRSGRLLFIFCRSPYPMRVLSECLLRLPLDLVAAQHLEGGGEATLLVRTPGLSQTLVGSYETHANDGATTPYVDLHEEFPLPIVLGVGACGPGK